MKADFFYNVAEGFITPHGGLHGMPIDINLRMLFYNRDHFDAAGMEYPRDDWSWAEFHSAARALTQVGLDGSVQRYGTNPFHGAPQPVLRDPYTAMGVRLVGVTAASQKKEAAYRLVKYFATSDTAQRLLSVRRVVWKSSIAMDRETLNSPPDINKISVIYALQHASPIYPLSVDWDEMQAFYESNLGPVWRLEMPFEAVAEIIDRGINAILSDGR